MFTRSKISILAIAALLAVPPAIAGWSAMGTHEPDTTYDVHDHWMTTDPDRSANLNVVYFNGFPGQYPLTGVNPNSGAAQTSMGSIAWKDFVMLGVWKDCNGDGYVGLGDQGVLDYRSELLVGPLNLGICDPGFVPDPIPENWMPIHNDGHWVREFLPIGWKQWNGDLYRYDINDNSSRVWEDAGVPGAAPGQGCWFNPEPRGTYHSTGGLLEFADCHANWAITDGIDAVAGLNGALASLSFADHPRDQSESSSILNIKNPWGDEQDASDASVWDCSQSPVAQARDPTAPQDGSGVLRSIFVSDPTGQLGDQWINFTRDDGYFSDQAGDTIYANASAPAVPTVSVPSPNVDPSDPTHSSTGLHPAGTANSTVAGSDRCGRRSDTHNAGGTNAPFDAEQGNKGGAVATLPYANEGDVKNSAAKIETFPFSYNSLHLATIGDLDQTGIASVDDTTGPAVNNTVGGEESMYLGISQGGALADNFWFETPNHVGPEIGPRSDGNIYWTQYVTYHAYVSTEAVSRYALVLPSGVTGLYGALNCGSHTSGVWNGWDCDASHWYRDGVGGDVHPTDTALGPCHAGDPQDTRCNANSGCAVGNQGCVSIAIYPGAPFNLRDVDCADDSTTTARSLGVYPGVIGGSNACADENSP